MMSTMEPIHDMRTSLPRAHEDVQTLSQSPLIETENMTSYPEATIPSSEQSLPSHAPLHRQPSPFTNPSTKRERSPALSDTSSLSDVPPSIASLPTATAFSALNGHGTPPPAKKLKLTFAEKEAALVLKQVKMREKSEEKAKKEAERSQRDFEKEVERQKKEAEREVERQKKEVEKEQKRIQKEAETAAKEEIKRKKEEERQKIEEEKKRKERTQPKLNAFFQTPKPKPVTREASCISNAAAPELLTSRSGVANDYEKLFPPFFLKEHVSLALPTQFQAERWGDEDVGSAIDTYITGCKVLLDNQGFDAATFFDCPGLAIQLRGKHITPVRDIMERVRGKRGQAIDLTTQSQNTQIRETRRLLEGVPYKFIKFSQDVRPPYIGTHTRHSLAELKKLARRPTKPMLEDLQYDYDSEAEWIEGDEEGDAEELMSDVDEEEEGDNDDEADGFIDDGDAENFARKALPIDQEPKSTGLCWENEKRVGPNLRMYGYRMEFMNDNVDSRVPIDPFSTAYWAAESTCGATSMEPPRIPLSTMNSANSISQPTTLSPSVGIGSHSNARGLAQPGVTGILITNPKDIEIFRETVKDSQLSKVGLIESIHSKMTHKSSVKKAVKNSLEAWATKTGKVKSTSWSVRKDVCPA